MKFQFTCVSQLSFGVKCFEFSLHQLISKQKQVLACRDTLKNYVKTMVQQLPERQNSMSKKTYKTILLTIHGLVLCLSLILFVCGLYVYIDHLTYHEAWHVSYGIYNGSVISMTISVILLAISILGM